MALWWFVGGLAIGLIIGVLVCRYAHHKAMRRFIGMDPGVDQGTFHRVHRP